MPKEAPQTYLQRIEFYESKFNDGYYMDFVYKHPDSTSWTTLEVSSTFYEHIAEIGFFDPAYTGSKDPNNANK